MRSKRVSEWYERASERTIEWPNSNIPIYERFEPLCGASTRLRNTDSNQSRPFEFDQWTLSFALQRARGKKEMLMNELGQLAFFHMCQASLYKRLCPFVRPTLSLKVLPQRHVSPGCETHLMAGIGLISIAQAQRKPCWAVERMTDGISSYDQPIRDSFIIP